MVVASAVRTAVAPRLAPRARPDRASRAERTIRRVARDGDAPAVLDGGASPTHPRRRDVLASLASAASAAALAPVLPASASLVEPTLAEVTPAVSNSPALTALEQGTVSLFERSTRSVVNVVDLTVLSGQAMKSGAVVPEGNGTGVVWDDQGHVVTNYHVLGAILSVTPENRRAGLECAKVTLEGPDGRTKTFSATLVGVERSKDLAVIKVNAPKEFLAPATIGVSRTVRVGQAVFAIGNPFGFDHTLTTGVVSGLNRTIQSQAGSLISGGIQTDAAINPGNSGGALLDASGALVGVNTAIFTNTGASAGVGFAIPVDLVARVVPQLIEFGRVTLPGLNIAVADPNVTKQLGVRRGRARAVGGAQVRRGEGGAAAHAPRAGGIAPPATSSAARTAPGSPPRATWWPPWSCTRWARRSRCACAGARGKRRGTSRNSTSS